jgi:hypothetical protein
MSNKKDSKKMFFIDPGCIFTTAVREGISTYDSGAGQMLINCRRST